jgi:hypothetical protein
MHFDRHDADGQLSLPGKNRIERIIGGTTALGIQIHIGDRDYLGGIARHFPYNPASQVIQI